MKFIELKYIKDSVTKAWISRMSRKYGTSVLAECVQDVLHIFPKTRKFDEKTLLILNKFTDGKNNDIKPFLRERLKNYNL